MVGLIQLFLFIKVLEEDFDAVMRGVSIEYGAARKGQNDVSLSLGWEKKRKRAPDSAMPPTTHNTRHEFVNNGRVRFFQNFPGRKNLGDHWVQQMLTEIHSRLMSRTTPRLKPT
jgi:hypothetical protein